MFAAILVFLGHAGQPFFSHGIPWFPKVAHEMVVIFFVLSGFLMSYVIGKQRSDWKQYFVDRFSRITSVAYPALLLTVVCDSIGRFVDPTVYAQSARADGYWMRIFLSSLFLQQSGPLASSPGTNTPYWSLAYEVWYYALLGIWTFVSGIWIKVLLMIMIIPLFVPKILLLLPVWLLGYFAYGVSSGCRLNPKESATLLVVSAVPLLLILFGHGQWVGYTGDCRADPPLYFSSCFVNDYLLAFLFAVNVVAVDQSVSGLSSTQIPAFFRAPAHLLSVQSFSLYAFHMPLLFLVSAVIPYDKGDTLQVGSALLVVVAIINLLWYVTERRRDFWKRIGGLALLRALH